MSSITHSNVLMFCGIMDNAPLPQSDKAGER